MEKIKYRHNILHINAVEMFLKIRGGFHQDCRDVFFVRALGGSADLAQTVTRMDQKMCEDMQLGTVKYNRIHTLPNLSTREDIAFYTQCYEEMIASAYQRIETRIKVAHPRYPEVLKQAICEVEQRFSSAKESISPSIKKNFLIKLLFWYDFVMKDMLTQWNEQSAIKIVADNVDKEQMYLFYYFLTMLGCDVLLLQTRKDVGNVACQALAQELILGDSMDVALQDYFPIFISGKSSTITNVVETKTEAEYRETVKIQVQKVVKSNANQKSVRQEKNFEELARLASSVVMISIHNQEGDVIGTGSGIMVGKNGYILTNNHVACGGFFYSVRIEEDEQIYRTDQVIKYNQFLDLAVIRIDKALQPIPIYQGEKELVRGQKVVAIGSPLGLFNSVSDGIISGFRMIDDVNMIQFTAPISHGSSGGAVLNMYGEVIGISTAGIDSGQNINLAVGYEFINTFVRGFL